MAGTKPYQFNGRGVVQLTGRSTGKSWNMDYINHWLRVMRPPAKISWQQLPGNKLKAYIDPESAPWLGGLREADMEPIQEWSEETNCGKRMAFDLWHFKNQKHITMFLLRWSS